MDASSLHYETAMRDAGEFLRRRDLGSYEEAPLYFAWERLYATRNKSLSVDLMSETTVERQDREQARLPPRKGLPPQRSRSAWTSFDAPLRKSMQESRFLRPSEMLSPAMVESIARKYRREAAKHRASRVSATAARVLGENYESESEEESEDELQQSKARSQSTKQMLGMNSSSELNGDLRNNQDRGTRKRASKASKKSSSTLKTSGISEDVVSHRASQANAATAIDEDYGCESGSEREGERLQKTTRMQSATHLSGMNSTSELDIYLPSHFERGAGKRTASKNSSMMDASAISEDGYDMAKVAPVNGTVQAKSTNQKGKMISDSVSMRLSQVQPVVTVYSAQIQDEPFMDATVTNTTKSILNAAIDGVAGDHHAVLAKLFRRTGEKEAGQQTEVRNGEPVNEDNLDITEANRKGSARRSPSSFQGSVSEEITSAQVNMQTIVENAESDGADSSSESAREHPVANVRSGSDYRRRSLSQAQTEVPSGIRVCMPEDHEANDDHGGNTVAPKANRHSSYRKTRTDEDQRKKDENDLVSIEQKPQQSKSVKFDQPVQQDPNVGISNRVQLPPKPSSFARDDIDANHRTPSVKSRRSGGGANDEWRHDENDITDTSNASDHSSAEHKTPAQTQSNPQQVNAPFDSPSEQRSSRLSFVKEETVMSQTNRSADTSDPEDADETSHSGEESILSPAAATQNHRQSTSSSKSSRSKSTRTLDSSRVEHSSSIIKDRSRHHKRDYEESGSGHHHHSSRRKSYKDQSEDESSSDKEYQRSGQHQVAEPNQRSHSQEKKEKRSSKPRSSSNSSHGKSRSSSSSAYTEKNVRHRDRSTRRKGSEVSSDDTAESIDSSHREYRRSTSKRYSKNQTDDNGRHRQRELSSSSSSDSDGSDDSRRAQVRPPRAEFGSKNSIVWPPGMKNPKGKLRIPRFDVVPVGLEGIKTEKEWRDYWIWLHWYSSWQVWYLDNDKAHQSKSRQGRHRKSRHSVR